MTRLDERKRDLQKVADKPRSGCRQRFCGISFSLSKRAKLAPALRAMMQGRCVNARLMSRAQQASGVGVSPSEACPTNCRRRQPPRRDAPPRDGHSPIPASRKPRSPVPPIWARSRSPCPPSIPRSASIPCPLSRHSQCRQSDGRRRHGDVMDVHRPGNQPSNRAAFVPVCIDFFAGHHDSPDRSH